MPIDKEETKTVKLIGLMILIIVVTSVIISAIHASHYNKNSDTEIINLVEPGEPDPWNYSKTYTPKIDTVLSNMNRSTECLNNLAGREKE